MKSIKKFLFIMVALATALAFVSCSNGDDDGGSSNNTVASVVATYESEDNYTLTFFADNTFTITFEKFGTEKTKWAGTYYMSEGNPSKNGSITITITKELNETSGVVQDIPVAMQVSEDGDIDYGELYIREIEFYRLANK